MVLLPIIIAYKIKFPLKYLQLREGSNEIINEIVELIEGSGDIRNAFWSLTITNVSEIQDNDVIKENVRKCLEAFFKKVDITISGFRIGDRERTILSKMLNATL